MTWIKEDATEFRRGRSILDYGKACITSGAVLIVHRNLEVRTLEVGIRGVDPEVVTTSPRYLEDIQADRQSETSRMLTDVSFRRKSGGAATTPPARKHRENIAVRPEERTIIAMRIFSVH